MEKNEPLCPCVPTGSPQDLATARGQTALQPMRPPRMLAQNAGMMAMGPAQSPGSLANTAAPSDMGLYSSAPAGQPGMYSLSPGLSSMLQHPNQSGMAMTHGAAAAAAAAAAAGPRQPGSGQGAGLMSGFGQNLLVNSALTPQHPQMKGPVGPAGPSLARSQAPPRLQSMVGAVQQGAPGWPQRSLQAMPGRTSGDLGAFNNGAGYPIPAGQPRLGKPPFQGALGQVVDAGTGAVRTLNPAAMGRQMMPGLATQQGGTQARPLVMSGLNQGVPGMPAFGQAPGQQQMPTGGFAGAGGQNQGYERAPPAQDVTYSYGGDSAGPPFPGLADGADLVDSIVKGGPGDEWMQELDELFGNP